MCRMTSVMSCDTCDLLISSMVFSISAIFCDGAETISRSLP